MSDESVTPAPAGVTPYLVIKGAEKAMEYYEKVFGAKVTLRLATPDGAIGHAEMSLGGGTIMLADEAPEMNIKSPETIGGSATGLLVYVDDPDAVFDSAVESGSTEFKPVADQFYGERSGTFDDPFGHRWTVSKRTEEITYEEIERRFQEFFGPDEDDEAQA